MTQLLSTLADHSVHALCLWCVSEHERASKTDTHQHGCGGAHRRGGGRRWSLQQRGCMMVMDHH